MSVKKLWTVNCVPQSTHLKQALWKTNWAATISSNLYTRKENKKSSIQDNNLQKKASRKTVYLIFRTNGTSWIPHYFRIWKPMDSVCSQLVRQGLGKQGSGMGLHPSFQKVFHMLESRLKLRTSVMRP